MSKKNTIWHKPVLYQKIVLSLGGSFEYRVLAPGQRVIADKESREINFLEIGDQAISLRVRRGPISSPKSRTFYTTATLESVLEKIQDMFKYVEKQWQIWHDSMEGARDRVARIQSAFGPDRIDSIAYSDHSIDVRVNLLDDEGQVTFFCYAHAVEMRSGFVPDDLFRLFLEALQKHDESVRLKQSRREAIGEGL